MKKRNLLTIKNYLIGLLISTIILILLGWMSHNFASSYFSNWKNIIIQALYSFAFSLLVVPAFLFSISQNIQTKKIKHDFKKGILIFIILFIIPIVGFYFSGNPINLKIVIGSIFYSLIFAVLLS